MSFFIRLVNSEFAVFRWLLIVVITPFHLTKFAHDMLLKVGNSKLHLEADNSVIKYNQFVYKLNSASQCIYS